MALVVFNVHLYCNICNGPIHADSNSYASGLPVQYKYQLLLKSHCMVFTDKSLQSSHLE